MKNKGRKHKAGSGYMNGIGNCKGLGVSITRDIRKMSQGPFTDQVGSKGKKYIKKMWSKRVRGYFKNQKDMMHDYPEYELPED